MSLIPLIHERHNWESSSWPVNATYQFTWDANDKPIPGSGHLRTLSTAPRMNWFTIDTIVMHYTAADNLIDGDAGERYEDIPAYLRAIQQSYAMNRAYSVGYNFAVDWLGGIWMLRGWDIKCAANKDHNDHTFAILCLVDGSDATTLAADNSIKWLVQSAQLRGRFNMQITGHGQLQNPHYATGCPGAGIMKKIETGAYIPGPIIPVETPPPTSKDNDMTKLYLVTDSQMSIDPAVFAISGTYAEWISTQGDCDALVLTGIAEHRGSPGIPPAQPLGVDRGFLKQYTLIGQGPTYVPEYTGPRTSPADFRKWVS